MQAVIMVSEAEWNGLLNEVARLRTEVEKLTTPATLPALPDRILNVREAAQYLRLKPEGIRKARRQGRLQGLHINEKEWGFRLSELNRYLTRYNRRPLDGPLPD
ncbi:helix-turn-helix domain-containing protein [Hymenobacter endophyticus]|uniref:Helix-turn-helix domain-containing protein n=1 Tax=Hymenobacter endophyticus TaxID=3076335 RepID=A0ABU3TDU7_9BACT|nr:helix-turn-helix domain-containing protein [Hymenobacter endophyticus]MDU0369544.1 helix-turn-helix domain-containing protein [Hymenobacter endophyticus]